MKNRLALLVVPMTALALAACSSSSGSTAEPGGSGSSSAAKIKQIVVATHDSWAAPKQLISQFEQQSGYTVSVVQNGDAGELTNKLVLTKGSPIADAVYGIDNTFASRAIDEGVLTRYHTAGFGSAHDLPGAGAQYLTPIDWGDVCVNVDDAWFSKHKLTPPASLDDLTRPAYKGLFVTPGAATSSPGFAFLLATISKYGTDGWQDYWKKLVSNGVKITAGWDDAFNVDYSAGGGNGDRPIVLSYNSDPVYSIPKGGTKPTTHALLDTCFQQTEYAGVLAGAKNAPGAKAFVDFLTSRAFQESLPENMYVFPVDPHAALPSDWAKWAPAATDPLTVAPDDITKHRQDWLTQWSDITS